jgi:predicted DNA-binding transcriptional regulator AlpA
VSPAEHGATRLALATESATTLRVVSDEPAVASGTPPLTYRYITVPEACAMTGYSRATIDRALRDGALTRYGLPRAPRILQHELVAWMTNPPAAKRKASRTDGRAGLPGSLLRW